MIILFTFATFRFFRDMPQIALDKKSNFEYLEKEVGPTRTFSPEYMHCEPFS